MSWIMPNYDKICFGISSCEEPVKWKRLPWSLLCWCLCTWMRCMGNMNVGGEWGTGSNHRCCLVGSAIGFNPWGVARLKDQRMPSANLELSAWIVVMFGTIGIISNSPLQWFLMRNNPSSVLIKGLTNVDLMLSCVSEWYYIFNRQLLLIL